MHPRSPARTLSPGRRSARVLVPVATLGVATLVAGGWSPAAAAPANDQFSSAAPVTVSLPTNDWAGATTTVTGSNVGATVQSGERRPSASACNITSIANTVWYSVKPARSGILRLNTAGSAFDTAVGVWQGSTLGSLTRVGCGNTTGGTELVKTSVKAGTTYYVQLAGTGSAVSGSYVLAASLRYFGPGNWPAGNWRPYAESSVFNRRLPAQPTLAPNSTQVIDRVIDRVPYGTPTGGLARDDRPNHGVVHTDGSSGEPTYFSPPPKTAATTTYTLHCTYGTPVLFGTCPLEGKQVRVPAGALPEGNNAAADTSSTGEYWTQPDAHMTIVDQWTATEYDLWQVHVSPVPAGGGQLSFSFGGTTPWNGNGLASAGNATASHFGSLAGRVRVEELQAGRINHALFIVVNCDNGSFVAPALHSGRACHEVKLGDGTFMSDQDAPPMGARLWLDMSAAEIDALPVPEWKKVVLRAFATYGAFIGDTGARGYFAIEMESGNQYTASGSSNPWTAWAAANGWPLVAPDPGYDFERYFGDWSRTADGIDWKTQVWDRLRVVDECVAKATC